MKISELFIIAIGLSMDAFAVSICKGLSMKKATLKNSLVIGAYFGIFQALMPLIGYFLGSLFAEKIQAFDHWLAFLILGILGIKMIYDGIKDYRESDCTKEETVTVIDLGFKVMIPFAIGTSIDALAAGVSFSFLNINIFQAILLIGVITFILSVVGVKIGNKVGEKVKSFSEALGGVILISMGVKILIEHTIL